MTESEHCGLKQNLKKDTHQTGPRKFLLSQNDFRVTVFAGTNYQMLEGTQYRASGIIISLI